jgi:drug/metabolite transporter (DMT)-like permease
MSSKPVVRPRTQRKVLDPDLGFSWSGINTVVLGLGIAVLVAGYVTLSRGSISLAPVLLVLGYCVLIPASLLIRARKQNPGE